LQIGNFLALFITFLGFEEFFILKVFKKKINLKAVAFSKTLF